MCDSWDQPATHTREDVIHAAMIRAGMCAARGLAESQACHPPGCEGPVTTGWPAGMLQDDSRELSKWLAGRAGARQCARDAAEKCLLAAGVPAGVSPAPRVAREPGGLLPVRLWGLARHEEETLDALCTYGRSKVVADVLCISLRAVEHRLSMINKKAGGTYLSSLLIALAWDRAKRAAA